MLKISSTIYFSRNLQNAPWWTRSYFMHTHYN